MIFPSELTDAQEGHPEVARHPARGLWTSRAHPRKPKGRVAASFGAWKPRETAGEDSDFAFGSAVVAPGIILGVAVPGRSVSERSQRVPAHVNDSPANG